MNRFARNLLVCGAALSLSACSLIEFGDSGRIDLAALPAPGGKLNVTATGADADEKMTWRINGVEQAERDKTLMFTPYSGEYTVTAIAPESYSILRIYGQDMVSNAPTVDGKITTEEWSDPPIAKLLPSKQDGRVGELTDENFNAHARNVWTDDALYFGVEINDKHEPNPIHGFAGQTQMVRLTFGDGELTKDLIIDTSRGPNDVFVDEQESDISAQVASAETANGYAIEARIPADQLPVSVKPGSTMDYQIVVHGNSEPLYWNPPQGHDKMGVAVILPDPSTLPGGQRQQLHGGETELKISKMPTTDPAYKTPLPVEYPNDAAELPEWLNLRLPWKGTHKVSSGYGFESTSWTHQTIGNKNSANDFYAIDIDMPIGTPIVAAERGRVIQSGRRGDSYGNYVVIDHGRGIQSIYAHLDSLEYAVDKGEPEVFVKKGDLLGQSGKSGTSRPHLHFAVHTGARASHSGANVGGLATVPEPFGGFYGVRQGHEYTGE